MKPPNHKPGKGRVLAVKWGYNPNSSSLGVDVTFFLLGASALAVLTPAVTGLLYLRRLRGQHPPAAPATTATAGRDDTEAS